MDSHFRGNDKQRSQSSRVKRDLVIYIAPEYDNNGARERKEDTMYKRLIRLVGPEQVSLGEPEQKRVYPFRNMFLNLASPTGANPHYP